MGKVIRKSFYFGAYTDNYTGKRVINKSYDQWRQMLLFQRLPNDLQTYRSETRYTVGLVFLFFFFGFFVFFFFLFFKV